MKYIAVGKFSFNSSPENVPLNTLFDDGFNSLDFHIHAPLFQSILNGSDWHDTAYYQQVREKLEDGVRIYGIEPQTTHVEDELDKWYQSRVELFNDIKENGCKIPITYVKKADVNGNVYNCMDDGYHRCGIAKVLGQDSVPSVCLNKELYEIAQQFYGGEQKLYQPIYGESLLSALSDWQVIRSGTTRRAQMIAEFLPSIEGKKVQILDIGCNMGYFSHLLADLCPQARVLAVDTVPCYAQWTATLTRVLSVTGPHWYKGRIVVWQGDYQDIISKAPFDVIVNLSVFHYIYLRDEDEFAARLNRLSEIADCMIFEMGTAEEHYIAQRLKSQHRTLVYQRDIPNLLARYTNFQVRNLGMSDYRSLFLCTHEDKDSVSNKLRR